MTSDPSSEIIARWIGSDIPASDLENAEWESACPVAITQHWSGAPAPGRRHAEVRMLWSPEALHTRFVCRQSEPLVIGANPQTETKTIGLWDRDVCEVFLAPDLNNPGRYFEFEAAPTGEWLDLGIRWQPDGRETDWSFSSGMSVAAQIKDDELVIALRIPWRESRDGRDSIPRPQPGERWRVNLFRCVGTGDSRYLAWRPTRTKEPNFHVPEVFGWLGFVQD